jgi:hypothetical protein
MERAPSIRTLALEAEKPGYARWYVGNKRVQRVGPKRSRGSSEGLTKKQAEAELRRMRLAEDEHPPPRSTVTGRRRL